jgi:hypothetical protein
MNKQRTYEPVRRIVSDCREPFTTMPYRLGPANAKQKRECRGRHVVPFYAAAAKMKDEHTNLLTHPKPTRLVARQKDQANYTCFSAVGSEKPFDQLISQFYGMLHPYGLTLQRNRNHM